MLKIPGKDELDRMAVWLGLGDVRITRLCEPADTGGGVAHGLEEIPAQYPAETRGGDIPSLLFR